MRWQDQRRSDNIEDRRRLTPRTAAIGGGLGTVAILLLAVLFGIDPRPLLNLMQQVQPPPRAGAAPANNVPLDPAEEERKDFVAAVLGSTEDVWGRLLPAAGREYRQPNLVLFSGRVESACGFASAAVGPFYCPGDEKVYLDLSFFQELEERFRAPGDFAQAYVIAHEVGHHVQNLLGTSDKVHRLQQRLGKAEANRLSVRLELQADFLAGVWANQTKLTNIVLEPGDIEAALRAASAIGDDRLQREGQGYVVPDSFTHGTSEQRVRWFTRGLKTGDLRQGNTFDLADDEL